jgi:hypothetical protein
MHLLHKLWCLGLCVCRNEYSCSAQHLTTATTLVIHATTHIVYFMAAEIYQQHVKRDQACAVDW